jgi:hypothetical protein
MVLLGSFSELLLNNEEVCTDRRLAVTFDSTIVSTFVEANFISLAIVDIHTRICFKTGILINKEVILLEMLFGNGLLLVRRFNPWVRFRFLINLIGGLLPNFVKISTDGWIAEAFLHTIIETDFIVLASEISLARVSFG